MTLLREMSIADREDMCQSWNDYNPVGTKVIVRDDDGEDHHTVTTSEAGMLGGHTPVISTEFKSCYLLTRVRRDLDPEE